MSFESINEVYVQWAKDVDNAVLGEIKQKAIENGIKTEYMLNEKAILSALEKQIPKKPRKTRCALMCANCGHKITEKGCKKLNRFYCKNCGQAIDWSDTE